MAQGIPRCVGDDRRDERLIGHDGKAVYTMKSLLRGVVVLLLVVVPACIASEDVAIGAVLDKVRSELRPLQFEGEPTHTASAEAYFRHYGLDVEGARHRFGTFVSGRHVLCAQVFEPGQPRGTVLIAHGYYDHAGVWRHVIRSLVARGYTVGVYDQPGHGLSSGARATIADFAEYVSAFGDFFELMRGRTPAPHHAVAHSMGGGVVADYLLSSGHDGLGRVVLVAPLYRSAMWRTSGVGHALGKPFRDSVKRVFRRNTSDPGFLRFQRDDPLQPRVVPFAWVEAHRKWEKRMRARGAVDRAVKIVQGTSDTTVAWRYNMRFFGRKLPNADVSFLKGGRHQLINEAEPMRTQVLDLVGDYLAAGE